MVKQIVFLVLSAMTMEACSTEQNTMEQVRMSDVVSFGCTSSFSATEVVQNIMRQKWQSQH